MYVDRLEGERHIWRLIGIMGNRYVITGVQLGILMGSLDEKIRVRLLQEIMDNQILEDVVKIKIKDKNFVILGAGEQHE